MLEKILPLFALFLFLPGCASAPPDIRVVCQRDDIGNYIVKWETNPPMQGIVKLYVSENPDSFPKQSPSVIANIANERVTYVTNDNITRQYFMLSFNDKYTKRVSSRTVSMDEIRNLRDIGGYQTRDKSVIRWGKLFRSGEPSSSNKWDMLRLNNLGIKTIIDLRTPSEVEANPIRYSKANIIHIPVAAGENKTALSDINNGRLRKGDGIIFMQDQYLQFVTKQSEQFGKALRIMLKEENYPILFSCTMGKDRNGFLAALVLLALDVPEATVMQDYVASNEFLNLKNFEYMGKGLDAEAQETITLILTANEFYLDTALSKIKKEYGSFQKYLSKELEITDKDLEKLKEIMLY